MRVLVLGASGFLGSATVAAARRQGLDVVSASRAEDTDFRCDVADPAELTRVLSAARVNAVVNCAVDADFGSGVLARQYGVNALAPAVIARWAARTGAHLVQVSATLVHGGRTEAVNAFTPVNPDTDYGKSKLLAEQMICASGCIASIVRLGGVFGARGPEHLSINRAIRAARIGTLPELVGEGSARRNYVFVDDAADALIHCVTKQLGGTFLLAGRETLTVRQMVQTVCEVFVPGGSPVRHPGGEARDQVIESSAELPAGRSFREALEHERAVFCEP